MKQPKISVITPSFNQEEFIERTILSIINQDYPNIEYIIIDGGSTDKSVDIIKKYDKDIAYWVSEKDDGQTDAINKGMEKATGDIVCWVNSDDLLVPGALKIVGDYFMEHPDIEFFNGLTVKVDKWDNILFIGHIINNKWFHKRGVYNISQQGMFWKRSLFDRIGKLDASYHYCMDVEWIVRLYANNVKMARTDSALGAIRVYAETKSGSAGKELWEGDQKKISEKYNGLYTNLNKTKPMLYLYGLVKLFKGQYFKDWLFKKRYAGKKLNDVFSKIKNEKL